MQGTSGPNIQAVARVASSGTVHGAHCRQPPPIRSRLGTGTSVRPTSACAYRRRRHNTVILTNGRRGPPESRHDKECVILSSELQRAEAKDLTDRPNSL